MGIAGAVLANVLILGTLALFSWLNEHDFDAFYQSLQEDEWLEWATFWGFFLAAVALGVAALRQRRSTGLWPWFLAGVASFCFVVGMEEISWGQRVLGYRPPAYFLEHNFQQELNVHNVMARDLRMLAVKVVILGYGVALPLLAAMPPVGQLLARLAVVAPPVELAPGFAAAYWTYETYPFKFSGEVTEFMMALGFLFAGLARARELGAPMPRRRLGPAPVALSTAVVLALGAANAWASRAQRSASPETMRTAQAELAALKRDFETRAAASGGRLPSKCGLHKRLYSYRRKYDQPFLDRGDFAALKEQGLPEERAEFFLDPWNSPYWLRDKCSQSRRVVFLYSFGPNRRRDSSSWEIRADDVGVGLVERAPTRRD